MPALFVRSSLYFLGLWAKPMRLPRGSLCCRKALLLLVQHCVLFGSLVHSFNQTIAPTLTAQCSLSGKSIRRVRPGVKPGLLRAGCTFWRGKYTERSCVAETKGRLCLCCRRLKALTGLEVESLLVVRQKVPLLRLRLSRGRPCPCCRGARTMSRLELAASWLWGRECPVQGLALKRQAVPLLQGHTDIEQAGDASRTRCEPDDPHSRPGGGGPGQAEGYQRSWFCSGLTGPVMTAGEARYCPYCQERAHSSRVNPEAAITYKYAGVINDLSVQSETGVSIAPAPAESELTAAESDLKLPLLTNVV